jgi:hypothetical protein
MRQMLLGECCVKPRELLLNFVSGLVCMSQYKYIDISEKLLTKWDYLPRPRTKQGIS